MLSPRVTDGSSCSGCPSSGPPGRSSARRPYPRKWNTGGDRDCDHTCSYRAAWLEEVVWNEVYRLISDRERLKRHYEAHVERKRKAMRGDPDREVTALAERLAKLERRRSGFLELAADGDMTREELRSKLAELGSQRGELERELRSARDQQQTLEELERAWKIASQMLQLTGITYVTISPEDRRRFYTALQLRVEIGADGMIRLSGIFDPDVYLLDLIQDPPIDPSQPVPEVGEKHRVVVASRATP